MKNESILAPAMIGELLEVIHNALLVVDSNQNIIFANSRTAEMFATNPDSLLGEPFSSLFMPDDVDILVQNILSITRKNKEIESEAMFMKQDGTTFFGSISGTCFKWAENEDGMVFSIHDISDMKEIELALKRSERIVFLGRLVDDISHQIRNPIVAIGGFARRLQSKYGSSDQVEIILNEAARLEKLLNTMNRFTSLPQPQTEKVKLGELLKELNVLVGAKVQELGCGWTSGCNERLLHRKILIDKKLLFQAILDVITNSCEAYSKESAIEDKIVQCEILQSNDDDFPFSLSIMDSGRGIAEHVKEHVFSHFYTDKTGHIGMGLTFARRIVEEQGGQVTLESSLDDGTTVIFRLIQERRRALRTRHMF